MTKILLALILFVNTATAGTVTEIHTYTTKHWGLSEFFLLQDGAVSVQSLHDFLILEPDAKLRNSIVIKEGFFLDNKPVQLPNGNLVLATSDRVYFIDPFAQLLNLFEMQDMTISTPAILDETVVVSAWDYLYFIDSFGSIIKSIFIDYFNTDAFWGEPTNLSNSNSILIYNDGKFNFFDQYGNLKAESKNLGMNLQTTELSNGNLVLVVRKKSQEYLTILDASGVIKSHNYFPNIVSSITPLEFQNGNFGVIVSAWNPDINDFGGALQIFGSNGIFKKSLSFDQTIYRLGQLTDKIYFASGSQSVYFFNQSGRLLDRFDSQQSLAQLPTVLPLQENLLLVHFNEFPDDRANASNTVYFIDAKGKILDTFNFTGELANKPVQLANGTILLGSTDVQNSKIHFLKIAK